MIQDVGDHFHGGAYGNGHHDDIGPGDAILIGNYFVHQADGFGRFGRHRILLHAQRTGRKAPPFQVQGHGAADQAQADDAYSAHIFIKALFRVSMLEQSEMRR